MRSRLFVAIFLSFITLCAQAQNSQWLNAVISQKEAFKAKENPTNNSFFTTHGLIFFYGSQCPHCKQFAPTLKHWSTRNKAQVLPLSLDNQPLPEFPKYIPATTEWINAAFGSNAINYPAIFIVNPKTRALYPVGFGEMTELELDKRMELLINKIKAYETKGSL